MCGLILRQYNHWIYSNDLTHQNLNGSYGNALCIYRYLTGESVTGNLYLPALITLSAGDITAIKLL